MKLLGKVSRLPAPKKGAVYGIGAVALIPFATNLLTDGTSWFHDHSEELGLGLGLGTAGYFYSKRQKKAAMWTAGFSLIAYAVEKYVFSPKDL